MPFPQGAEHIGAFTTLLQRYRVLLGTLWQDRVLLMTSETGTSINEISKEQTPDENQFAIPGIGLREERYTMNEQ